MIIIVEGVDRVGKSTMCERLKREFNFRVFHDDYKPNYITIKPESDKEKLLIDDCINVKFSLIMQFMSMWDNIIIDRFHFTEFVYNHMRGQAFKGFQKIDRVLSKLNVHLVLVKSENIIESSKQHGEDLRVHEAMFKSLYHSSRVPYKYCTSYSEINSTILEIKMNEALRVVSKVEIPKEEQLSWNL